MFCLIICYFKLQKFFPGLYRNNFLSKVIRLIKKPEVLFFLLHDEAVLIYYAWKIVETIDCYTISNKLFFYREVQGIRACCNPVPVLVQHNLHYIHQIILQARDIPLIEVIELNKMFFLFHEHIF